MHGTSVLPRSPYSDISSIAAAANPDAPDSLEALSDGDVIQLYWRFAGNTGGAAIDRWNIYVTDNGEFEEDGLPIANVPLARQTKHFLGQIL